MKLILPAIAVFWVSLSPALAEDAEKPCKDPKKNGLEAVAALAKGGGCVSMQAGGPVDAKAAKALAAEDAKNGTTKVLGVYATPFSRTSTSLTYKLPKEVELKPGEAIYFAVPADISQQSLNFAILGHRQDPNTEKGFEDGEWDNVPGKISAQFHSIEPLKSGQDRWRYWRGQASGAKGAKFAEVREKPEMENLYDWLKYGHAGVDSEDASTNPLKVDVVRLVSTGQDPVLVSEFTMKVNPPKPDKLETHIFSEGTDFGDPDTKKGQSFGGGQGYEGLFPGALAINPKGYGHKQPKLPQGWRLRGERSDRLHIPLPAGYSLANIELAVGDSHPDKVTNKDGGSGTSGWSKLSAVLRRANGSEDRLISNENVPPEGVVIGAPADPCYVTKAGDELVISAEKDTSYLMGLRLWLSENQ